MNMLIEFLLFIFILPCISLYALARMATSVADYFGAWFIPGATGIYLGLAFIALGQPDPSVEYQTITQAVAGITVAGVSLPAILIVAGLISFVVGATLRLKKTNSAG